jgi:hypothetical protein
MILMLGFSVVLQFLKQYVILVNLTWEKSILILVSSYLPPHEGAGLLQVLVLVRVPVPVTWLQVQLLQASPVDHPPFTGNFSS